MIVLFVVGALVYAVLLTGDRSTARFDTTRVTVRSGDTLWSIAERHPLKGCTTEQTAAVLGEINGLDDSAIIAGSAIDVPAPHDSDALLAMR
jgi:LysM repeat protein